jgi:Type II restriction endonuclease EcoO109I
MGDITLEEIYDFIETNIFPDFYQRKLARMNKLTIYNLLKSKNPYLFNTKYYDTAEKLVTDLLFAFLSSSEETMFGGTLEQLAIFICEKVYGGRKSGIKGIDLEFENESVIYVVAIKSSPKWGNKGQKDDMKLAFQAAKKAYGSNNPRSKKVIAVNGCCYGKDSRPDKSDYLKLCGQVFWSLISGDEEMYGKILVPLKKETEVQDAAFKEARAAKIAQLTVDFKSEFWTDGQINWAKWAELNCGIPKPKEPKPPRTPRPRIPRKPGNSRRKKNAGLGNQPTLLPKESDV